MDNPAVTVFLIVCVAPLLIFLAGVWVGAGMPGSPVVLTRRRGEVRTYDDDYYE